MTQADIIFIGIVLGLAVLAWLGWWALIYVRTMRGWVSDVAENPEHLRRLGKAALDIPVGAVEDVVKDAIERELQPRRGFWRRGIWW
jgi:hypothetical protein